MKSTQYEQLMQWTIRNVDNKIYSNVIDLAYNIQELDIHNVVTNQSEFNYFVKDLEKRIGKTILNKNKSFSKYGKRNLINDFFNNHYINLNDWELKFFHNIKRITSYSEKQELAIGNILKKYDKLYYEKFINF